VSSDNYHVPISVPIRRAVMRVVARGLYRLLGRVRTSGMENVPLGTTYVAAINHISIYDPPLILGFWPEPIEVMGAADVFDKPVQGQIVWLYGTTPVHRGQHDSELLEIVLAQLRAGRPLLIAPEGGRSHALAMRRAKPGIAYIVDQVRVPIVPVGIMGTTDDFLKRGLQLKRPQVELRIGKSFMLPPLEGKGEARRAARQRNADLVMQHIAELLPPEYHGVYSAQAAPLPS
jgi:1-acyl-sn-glycerol-3-phosphate acyltransferase